MAYRTWRPRSQVSSRLAWGLLGRSRYAKSCSSTLRFPTPDEAVDRLIIAGTPAQCIERFAELFSFAARHEFAQVFIGVPLGPDVQEVIDIWGKEILPALR